MFCTDDEPCIMEWEGEVEEPKEAPRPWWTWLPGLKKEAIGVPRDPSVAAIKREPSATHSTPFDISTNNATNIRVKEEVKRERQEEFQDEQQEWSSWDVKRDPHDEGV